MMPLPSEERARHYRQEDPAIALVLMSHCGLMFSYRIPLVLERSMKDQFHHKPILVSGAEQLSR
jgi:hypothetical protein